MDNPGTNHLDEEVLRKSGGNLRGVRRDLDGENGK
jgi:hypothetical protein